MSIRLPNPSKPRAPNFPRTCPRKFPGGNMKGAARRPSSLRADVSDVCPAAKLLAQTLLHATTMRNPAAPLLDREECVPPRPDGALAKLPARVRDIATLRGLGFTCLEIGRRFGITPQAVSATLSRHHRRIDDMKGCPEMSELSGRSVNALSRIGVNSRAEACGRDIFTLLLRERNCGAKSLEEIRRWLERGGAATGENNYL